MITAVDTRTVQRRELKFRCLDCLRGELDRIEFAHHEGTLRSMGNWTPGQILDHLASWINYSYDGYPPDMPRTSPLLRPIVSLAKKRILTHAFSPGFRFRGVPGGTFATEDIPVLEGLKRLRAAVNRLETDTNVLPSPAFGKLTHDEVVQLHLRHAELHLGFLTLS